MKILYDASSLGRGFGSELTRSGIFRVTREFIGEILGRRDLDVHFAAFPSLVDEIQLARYERQTHFPLGDRLLSVWETGDPVEECIDLVDRIDEAGPDPDKLAIAKLKLLDRTATPLAPPGRFDIYHSLRPPLAASSRVRAAARVVTIPDAIPRLFPELCGEGFVPAFDRLLDSIDATADWIMCNSSGTKEDICAALPMLPERVHVIPLAASSRIFFPEREDHRIRGVAARYGISDAGYVLSLGTLEPRKNLPCLIRAFTRLASEPRYSELQLVLVGATGWKAEAIFAAIEASSGCRDRIVLTGHVPDADLAALYGGARLFVFPSLYEGFGLPVLEAMQCGTPVVASNVSAIPEVVGDAALLVEPDEWALQEAMLKLLGNPNRAALLGQRGAKRAALFSWARTVDETLAAYRRILG